MNEIASQRSASRAGALRRRTAPPGAVRDSLPTGDGLRLRVVSWQPEATPGCGSVLVVPGRTEYVERHFETAADLLDRGLAVAVLEMRGHGLSPRPLANPMKHHASDFSAMIDDVARFFAYASDSRMPRPHILLAHSMGAHVAFRVLHERPRAVEAAVLTAPMFGLRLEGLPRMLVPRLARLAVRLGLGTRYALGQSDWRGGQAREMLRDLLTSDRERFADEDRILAEHPELRLGGVTWGWLDAAFRSMAGIAAPGYAEVVTTPLLLVLAGADRVVDNRAAEEVAARLPHGKCVVIEGARHDILHESDPYRDRFWAAFDEFRESLSRG
ncbi:MAG: alpha/beta fold hydrolase [Rhodothalassiaceae bacterium]